VEKKNVVYLESTTRVRGRNVRFYSSDNLFPNGFKFTIGFVGLHVSPIYLMVDLKRICMKIVDKWLGE
jgi:hypothetical protein